MIAFGRQHCAVDDPKPVLTRIAEAMRATLKEAAGDDRIPKALLADLCAVWEEGLLHGR